VDLGDHVIFTKDPALYGVLRVGVKTADGRFVCEPAHPSVPVNRRRAEIFFANELSAYTGEIIDLAAERARLEEADTQAAQDADRASRRERDRGLRVRPRLLDLFCGAGGASKGYAEAGFDVPWRPQHDPGSLRGEPPVPGRPRVPPDRRRALQHR
jgi:hypothetical protein